MTPNVALRSYTIFTRLNSQTASTARLHSIRHASFEAVHRRTNIWVPGVSKIAANVKLDATALLARAGFIRQAYAGIYQMLPLGLRVQSKIEQLIDKHMLALGASKLSLSSFASQDLWRESGRLEGATELFTFKDRKGTGFLLNPTHEEEITRLIAESTNSHKQLPIRVYQVGRKYRDERRPRGGLLRGREFLMKDLYTFDIDESEARATYDHVRNAYGDIFDELKVDYLSVQADSGNMGGSLSHEYHLTHSEGEDDLVHCPECGYARNEELVEEMTYNLEPINLPERLLEQTKTEDSDIVEHLAISKDGASLVRAFTNGRTSKEKQISPVEFNSHAIKAAFSDQVSLDTGVEHPLQQFQKHLDENQQTKSKIYYLFDNSLPSKQHVSLISRDAELFKTYSVSPVKITSTSKISLLKTQPNDPCPQCHQPALQTQKAIEVAHTFHLGTRYSTKLSATTDLPGDPQAKNPMQMGCHGIGVSRLIAAIASVMSDPQALHWPRVIAPFQVAVLADNASVSPGPRTRSTSTTTDTMAAQEEKAAELDEKVMSFCSSLMAYPSEPLTTYISSDSSDDSGSSSNGLSAVDVLYDDRASVSLGWKLKDATLIGCPVVVIFGRAWEKDKSRVEIRCKRLDVMGIDVDIENAARVVRQLLDQL